MRIPRARSSFFAAAAAGGLAPGRPAFAGALAPLLPIIHRLALASVVALALPFALGGCGYRVLGAGPPFGLHRIALVPFVEDVPVGIAGDLAADLAQEIGAQGVALTLDPDAADAVLTGRVLSSYTTHSLAGVRSYRVTLVVLATLRTPKQELWSTQLSIADDFLPGPPVLSTRDEPLSTEANRREALRRLSREAARTLVAQLRRAAATRGSP